MADETKNSTGGKKADKPEYTKPGSIIEIARAADEEAKKEAARVAAIEQGEYAEAPFSIQNHPDGTPRKMVVCRMNGLGEREITVKEWETNPAYFRAAVGSWQIKYTEAVAPHHSDDATYS